MGDGSRLTRPSPEPGESSLPIEALQNALGIDQASDDSNSNGGGSWRLASLRRKLEEGQRVRVLAIGASNTAMFAPACQDAGCEASAHEPMESVRRRFEALAERHGALRNAQPDWLVRLLLTLHRQYPAAPLLGVAQAYGGFDPKMVAMCLADFLEGATPFKALGPACRTPAGASGNSGAPTASDAYASASACSDDLPDLLILDFAIYAGKKPLLSYLSSIEKLMRYLWPHVTAAHPPCLTLTLCCYCTHLRS